jgi:hypothetical protein
MGLGKGGLKRADGAERSKRQAQTDRELVWIFHDQNRLSTTRAPMAGESGHSCGEEMKSACEFFAQAH